MMKRFFTILTAALLIVAALTACSGAKSKDLKAVMDKINTDQQLTGLKQIESTDDLNRYYQIEAASVKQFAAELSSSATDYTEIILIEAVDQSAADSIKKQLDLRLRNQLSNAKSYAANQVAMIEACEAKETGSFVTLVIGDKHAEIEATVAEALK